jgi:predicted ATPase
MAILKKIEIHGYRSIKSASLELRPLNVLIGANGSGKSNFVSFFKLLNEMMGERLQEYIGMSGRAQSMLHFGPKVTPQIQAELEFAAETAVDWYSMRLFHAAGDTLVFADETLKYQKTGFQRPQEFSLGAGHQESRIGTEANRDNAPAKVFRYLLSQCRVYHFHDTSLTARIRQSGFIHDNRWLMPDAGNLAAMLFAYRQKEGVVYQRIVSTIRKIMPEFDDFDVEPSRLNPNDILLTWRKRGQEYLFGAHQLSDGTLRAMAIVTLLLQPDNSLPDVIILDEPELGLHPHALEIVAGLIRAVSVNSQVIVATQSPTFLNHFEPEEVVTVESHQGQSTFRRLDAEQLQGWLAEYSIGDLWQRNVVGAGPLP